VDRSSAESALVEALKVPRAVGCEERCPPGEGSAEGARPDPQKIFLLFDLKMEHFGAVFKQNLTEETRTQLQEEEAIASSCLILASGYACDGSAIFIHHFYVFVSFD